MPFDLDPNYKQVPERIADLKKDHPDARLRPVDPTRPYWLEEIEGQTFIVYAAACYLSPDDPLPGIGTAWEPFPGRTPYTKDSELQNAETSAWGRAIVAALQSESKAIASAEDVRNRAAEHAEGPRESRPPSDKQIGFLNTLLSQMGVDVFDLFQQGVIEREVVTVPDLTGAEVKKAIDHLIAARDGKPQTSNRAPGSGGAPQEARPATQAQLKAIAAMGKKCELSDDELSVLVGVPLTQLTTSSASKLIDQLNETINAGAAR